jgi:hypothetical protein
MEWGSDRSVPIAKPQNGLCTRCCVLYRLECQPPIMAAEITVDMVVAASNLCPPSALPPPPTPFCLIAVAAPAIAATVMATVTVRAETLFRAASAVKEQRRRLAGVVPACAIKRGLLAKTVEVINWLG